MNKYSLVKQRVSTSSVPSVELYPVKFAPLAQERIWGGHQLKSWFSVKEERPIGEYWLLSSHPAAISVVQNGALKGTSLAQLTEQYPQAFLGNSPQRRFPLLIKLIEARDDLSVQVHPADRHAIQRENDYGKTEAWYILDPGTEKEIIYGHHFRDREQFLQAAKENNLSPYLKRKRIAQDQLVFVPAGTVHAIQKGTMLLEIQQTSDVTYRIYDWDRLDQQGNPRKLHVDEAAEVIDYRQRDQNPYAQSKPIFRGIDVSHDHLLTCPYFTIERIHLGMDRRYRCRLGKTGNPDVLVVLEGEGTLIYQDSGITVPLQRGDAVLIPATLSAYELEAWSSLKIIRTYY